MQIEIQIPKAVLFPHGTDYGAGRHYGRIEKQRSDGMGSPGKQCKKPGR